MGLIDGITNAILEKQEKERDIEDNNSYARETIDDAENRLSNSKDYLEKSFYWLNDTIESHTELRKEISKQLASNVSPALTAFKKFEIDGKISCPSISSSSISIPSVSKFSHSFSVSSVMREPRLPDIFDSGSLDRRLAKSEENKRAAIAYSDKVNRLIEKSDAIQDQNDRIEKVLEEDGKILKSLVAKVNYICGELTNAMKSDSFTQEQADTLNGMYQIANQIISHIQTDCLTGSNSIASSFQSQHSALAALNREIPNKPDLKNTSELNSLLRRMIET